MGKNTKEDGKLIRNLVYDSGCAQFIALSKQIFSDVRHCIQLHAYNIFHLSVMTFLIPAENIFYCTVAHKVKTNQSVFFFPLCVSLDFRMNQ